ncbi:MAG: hypothetical protein EB060_07485 [Proteobacteria bacterium]|nr:hypothetical protein [Pseudomonadota bacterium]
MGGHANDIAKHLHDHELRKRLDDQAHHPLALLGFHLVAAAEVDYSWDGTADYMRRRKLSVPEWMVSPMKWAETKHSYPKTDNLFMYPIDCTYINLDFTNPSHAELDLDEEKRMQAVMKLNALGCRVFAYKHSYSQQEWFDGATAPEKRTYKQSLFSMPTMLLKGTAENPQYDRDIEGRAIFYRWMIHQGLATERQIEEAFTIGYLKESQKPQIIKTVNDMFGAPRAELNR